MNKFTDIYGYCIIPKGTVLYRGHSDNSFKDCMFFATTFSGASIWNDNIQIWKTTTEIEVLFAVEYVDSNTIGISALPAIFNNIYPLESNPNFSDLDIKHWDIERRDKFVNKLFNEYQISGWFTSVENNTFNEVCLFDKQTNSMRIKLHQITNRNDNSYYKDSLQKIKFFLPKEFYERTLKELNKHSTFPLDREETYKKHKRYVRAWVKEFIEQGKTRDEAKHEMISLRTQLKV